MQGRKAQERAMPLAIAMIGGLVLVAGLLLAGMPGESAAKVCQLQLSGPLAGSCAER